MAIKHQVKDSASPVEMEALAKAITDSCVSMSILAINGGSSSIRFALLYKDIEPLRQRIGGLHSRSGLEANAHALARYAALCQEAGLVPVVEPEVLMDGDHTLEQCLKVTEEALRNVFIRLNCQRVMLEGIILKPNMVLPGLISPQQVSVDEVADATVTCLLRTVPAAVPKIAFLSGGQFAETASTRLNTMNVRFKSRMPKALSLSFALAIRRPAMERSLA